MTYEITYMLVRFECAVALNFVYSQATRLARRYGNGGFKMGLCAGLDHILILPVQCPPLRGVLFT